MTQVSIHVVLYLNHQAKKNRTLTFQEVFDERRAIYLAARKLTTRNRMKASMEGITAVKVGEYSEVELCAQSREELQFLVIHLSRKSLANSHKFVYWVFITSSH